MERFMALKETNQDNLNYLDQLLKDNGLELILPDLEKDKKKKEETKKEEKKDNK